MIVLGVVIHRGDGSQPKQDIYLYTWFENENMNDSHNYDCPSHSKMFLIDNLPGISHLWLFSEIMFRTKKKYNVINHINSFLKVESHYCRQRTSKTYLESTLSISKMFELYELKCTEDGKEDLLCKKKFYSDIFNTNFNIAFHLPQSDRCDQCEKYKISEKEGLLSPEMFKERADHINEKDAMRNKRNLDRADKNKLATCFDLQNVINCPRANVSSFFYTRKLN